MASVSDHHSAADHVIEGDHRERLRRVLARHLCGWLAGHACPVGQFLVDADLIVMDVEDSGLRVTD